MWDRAAMWGLTGYMGSDTAPPTRSRTSRGGGHGSRSRPGAEILAELHTSLTRTAPALSPRARGRSGADSRGRSLEVLLELVVLGLLHQEAADHEGHDRHPNRVPEAVVDIARGRDHGRGQQGEHPPEP